MIRHRRTRLLLALLALTPFLGLAGPAPVAPAASPATCCNLASAYTSSLFPGGDGDEGFFGLPVGAPANTMILLDNSASMLDFPNPLPDVPATNGTGTCTGTFLNDHSVFMTDTPYDNGTTSTFLVDDPSWGLNRCRAGQDDCLFAGQSYYRYRGGPGYEHEWGTDWAKEFAAGSSAGRICEGAGDATECQTCLDTAGYYLFRTTGGVPRRVFKGAFLNAYPPKFVVARKVVKDLVTIDPDAPDEAASVRFGLSVFNTVVQDDELVVGGATSSALRLRDGAVLVVPVGPNCASSQAGFQASVAATVAAYQAARQALLTAVNDPWQVTFTAWTPLAESLFNIGQYFSDTIGTSGSTIGDVDGPVYDYMFGSDWARGTFRETRAGTVSAGWVSSGQHSICWACQQSSVVVVTDGEPRNDGNLPKDGAASHTAGPTPRTPATEAANDFRGWNAANLTVPCAVDIAAGCAGYTLQKVAYFLAHNDLRPDLSNAKQTQTVTTYTVSFGIQPVDAESRRALALLDWTAQLGGGKFYNTLTGDELRSALYDAVGGTVARATSFSVSNTNTLQTANSSQLFLARFRKLVSPAWEGHLTRFKVFNEYVQGCDDKKSTADQTPVTCGTKTLNPNLDGNESCTGKAICDGLYVLDAECDPVAEDENGDFRKATLTGGKFVTDTTRPAAVPYWDAGENLSYRTFPATHPDPAKAGLANAAYRSADEHAADKRAIYTVVDSDGDGKFTGADTRVPFEADWASWLAPYLELNGMRKVGIDSVNVCASLLHRAGLCGDPAAGLPACPTPDASGRVGAADVERCARQVIHWVRGWDAFDEDGDGCAGPDAPLNDPTTCAAGEERNRENDLRTDREFWKLGDIFHSSPVLVKPPATEMVCDLGLENQCVATLHSPKGAGTTIQTPADYDVDGNGHIDPGEDAYERYRRDHAQRRQIVLVGANDGMLHAFDAGSVDGAVPADWLGTYSFTPGTGAELWAFIPPDLLPKLKLAIDGHQYFVDGNPMVRDVWVDADRDGRKDPDEFHTMVVLSERSGGSQYVGLDVTDTEDPAFRWTFPENCTLDQNVFGQSWSGFAPRPPPIGPVKLALDATSPADPTHRNFEERWIVMVNGGYDPTLTRGRGVWMLDVWSGKTLWRFTDDDLKDVHGSDANMWSVPAAVGMVDIGTADQATLDSDGFFDTATWGDMGGQLFVARFHAPGTRSASTGRVTNWYAARAFEEQRQANDSQPFSGRSEFFYMTANAVDLDRGYLHSYLGGGNREHLLQVGAACGPGNILGCCQAGCNAEMFTMYNYGGANVVNHVKCSNGKMVQDKTNASGTTDEAYACGKLVANVQLHLQCGAAGNPPDIIGHLHCDADGNCSSREHVTNGKPVKTEKLTQPTWHTRFYGIYAYGGASRTFSTQAGAQALDDNRFTDVTFAGPCAGAASCTLVDTTHATVSASGAVSCPVGLTRCSANGDDAGWFYEVGRRCPTGSCEDALPWADEKTASGATVLAGCVDWNTFRPRGVTAAGTDPCTGGNNTGQARNYTYLADFVSGVPSPTCGFEWSSGAACTAATQFVRARQRTTIAPPPDPTQLVAIGMDGEVKYLAAQIEPGGTPTTAALGAEHELVQPAYWLEVSRELHTCRHVEASACR